MITWQMTESSLIRARAEADHADLVMMLMIERFNHDGEFRPNALTVAAHIQGAPIAEVEKRLVRLANDLQVIERTNQHDFMVTQLGVELLLAEVSEFWPSTLEQAKRDAKLTQRN